MSDAPMQLVGTLEGHSGWVTSIATSSEHPNTIISGSRDKTLIVWEIKNIQGNYGIAKRALRGHNHFVSDVVFSSDAQCAISSSWDGTLRLWDVSEGNGNCIRRFTGHTKDVLTVALSADNRQIVSGGRDKNIKLWNTLGEMKFNMSESQNGTAHDEWVSCVRFSPSSNNPLVVSCGWDKKVKVWNLQNQNKLLQTTFKEHTGYLNTVTVSPDGSLCASGGKDGTAMLWDLTESKHLYSLNAEDIINALIFSPNRYWLVAATQKSIKIWDLESKEMVAELKPEVPASESEGSHKRIPYCVTLAWSADGLDLFAGFTDNKIRVYHVTN